MCSATADEAERLLLEGRFRTVIIGPGLFHRQKVALAALARESSLSVILVCSDSSVSHSHFIRRDGACLLHRVQNSGLAFCLVHVQVCLDGLLQPIRKYDCRYSQLTLVFGKLLRESRLGEEELCGLRQDKLESIRSYARFLAKMDAA